VEEENMKYGAFVVVALMVAIATYTATAWSAAAPTPTEQKLQRQINTLKSQVAKLQKDDKTLKSNVNDLIGGVSLALVLNACTNAVTADALQGTWQIVDQVSAATQAGKTYFGPQTAVSDSLTGLTAPACAALQVIRSQALPPTSAQLDALLGVLRSAQLKSGYRLAH
jgi:cell division protein FtsB